MIQKTVIVYGRNKQNPGEWDAAYYVNDKRIKDTISQMERYGDFKFEGLKRFRNEKGPKVYLNFRFIK